LGIGDWAQSPIPNPQSPIPNPHLKIKLIKQQNLILINKIYLFIVIKIKIFYYFIEGITIIIKFYIIFSYVNE